MYGEIIIFYCVNKIYFFVGNKINIDLRGCVFIW